jgi:uracil-DNA glycosylase
MPFEMFSWQVQNLCSADTFYINGDNGTLRGFKHLWLSFRFYVIYLKKCAWHGCLRHKAFSIIYMAMKAAIPPLFELEPSWHKVLADELSQPYITTLASFVTRERLYDGPIYPPAELVFNAFWHTPYSQAKVVIVGQDPYHGAGQAHGLAFSVPYGVAQPPSLKNIFKEMCDDVGGEYPKHGCLLPWADQGVFLLNTLLTVRAKTPLSHQKQGWERFTDAVIRALAARDEPLVFLLWGKPAQEKCRAVETCGKHHLVLRAPHPSPFSAHQGFLGCRHFSKTNEQLKTWGLSPIAWSASLASYLHNSQSVVGDGHG